MVDAVSAVIDIEAGQIEPPPRFGNRVRNDFIAGMGKVKDQFVIILDVGKTFTAGDSDAMNCHWKNWRRKLSAWANNGGVRRRYLLAQCAGGLCQRGQLCPVTGQHGCFWRQP